MNTAVAIIIFNRPEATRRVIEALSIARPKQLFVIADGPRLGNTDDVAKCFAARAVIERVDWPCSISKNYSDTNLGVGVRPASGIKWVFSQTDAAIILEDDCVPHPTFFRYCDELLDKYADDERVMHISGDNWHFGERPSSYFFSCYCYSCGWATWSRAFRHYDENVSLWPTLRDTPWLMDILGDARAVEFWAGKFDLIREAGIETHGWDWPWLFACWAHRGISILPSTNLISNIGFDEDATHTKSADDERAFVPTAAMAFPLTHPVGMIRDTRADQRIFEQVGPGHEPQGLYYSLRRQGAAALPAPIRRSLSSLRSPLKSRR